MRENRATKARRLLAEGRVVVDRVQGRHVRAFVRGDSDDFYDVRHVRVVRYLRGELADLPEHDLVYLANAVRYAWPLTAQLLADFLGCAARRRRLLELEAERLELLGVAS